ncbi:phosphopantetheine-binding protein [Streptomyces sp. NPDC056161]|uniref:phosphopantetheine-binding protein n=1 Tax=Streptomyces sp. NPDC056161 TaxID=3345732 RepID=UPI0035D9DFC8
MEKEIAGIWAEILEVDDVLPDSSFYDFGGTSLQAMRICARIERITGYEVSPESVFDTDTFRDFVARVRAMDPAQEAGR